MGLLVKSSISDADEQNLIILVICSSLMSYLRVSPQLTLTDVLGLAFASSLGVLCSLLRQSPER